MKRPVTIYTPFEDFKNSYKGEYFNYFQIHIYSMAEVISTYYIPELTTIETVKKAAQTILEAIRKRSDRKNRITLFQKNGKFLIAESEDLIDQGEVLKFNEAQMCYEYADEYDGSQYFLNKIKIDSFIKNSFITIGAEDLFEEVVVFAQQMRENNDAWELRNEKLRLLNASDPRFTLEIYKIEKDYKPVLKSSIQCHSEEAIYLPEYFNIIQSSQRYTYILKEITTNKIIEGNLEEDIESIKHSKWQRKNPSVIDLEAMQRMELDDDDPNYLSYDDYVANEDELEEGDNEYSPRF
ncbi:hypothetical protein BST83_10575 [Polaribacter filamentus]|uniref:Uncharacterized protein n=1 Tax=Polaribacter filamentus TaxID=53483 RepID=A0A2S7KYG7_9FLAO|nr:hypothetical protein [Polaribacter filamentus]PQB07553.1 hypothetical protein BST83_10575 [Polaribacter filamentus]